MIQFVYLYIPNLDTIYYQMLLVPSSYTKVGPGPSLRPVLSYIYVSHKSKINISHMMNVKCYILHVLIMLHMIFCLVIYFTYNDKLNVSKASHVFHMSFVKCYMFYDVFYLFTWLSFLYLRLVSICINILTYIY